MKQKFSILVITLCLICTARLSAQSVRFQVQSPDGEPLPYCYVFINQNFWGTTDLSGEAAIPDSQLHVGDSLTFHYIGNNDAVLVWAGQTADTVSLTPQQLQEVVVVATLQDLRLRQAIKAVQPVNWLEEFSGRVDMQSFHNGHAGDRYSGTFMNVFIPWGGPKNNPNVKLPKDEWNILKMKPEQNIDTFRNYFKAVIWQSILLAQFSPQAQMNRNISIRNSGVLDDMSVYIVTRAYAKDASNYQLRVYVDTESRILRRIAYYGIVNDNTVMEMTVDYRLSEGQTRNYPREIRAAIKNTLTSETIFTYDISNTTLSGANKAYYQEHRDKLLQGEAN